MGTPAPRVCQEHEPIFQGLPGCLGGLGLLCSQAVRQEGQTMLHLAQLQSSEQTLKSVLGQRLTRNIQVVITITVKPLISNPRKKSHRSPANVGFMGWQCKPEDGGKCVTTKPLPLFSLSCTAGASLMSCHFLLVGVNIGSWPRPKLDLSSWWSRGLQQKRLLKKKEFGLELQINQIYFIVADILSGSELREIRIALHADARGCRLHWCVGVWQPFNLKQET